METFLTAPKDRYSGDPRLILTKNGATLDYNGGNPVMDQGIENCALLSLLVEPGWCGNIFLKPEERIGSDYLPTCRKPITRSNLIDIENAAERALSTSKVFGTVEADTTNPTTDHLRTEIKIGSGGSLTLARERALWRAQADFAASDRIRSPEELEREVTVVKEP